MAKKVTLAECPVGLFEFEGTLCFKSQYGDNNGGIDAYVVESGEFFAGGVSDKIDRRRVMVKPVKFKKVSW